MSNPNHTSNDEISDELVRNRTASVRMIAEKLAQLAENFNAQRVQVESFGKQLGEVQTVAKAIQPEKIEALVKKAVSQLPIPSAAAIANEIQKQVDGFLRSIRGTLDDLNEQVQSLTKATSALQKEGQQTQEARKELNSVLKQLQEIVQSASLQNLSQVTQQMGEIQQELIIIKETVQQPSPDKIQIPPSVGRDNADKFSQAMRYLDRFSESHDTKELNEAEDLLRPLADWPEIRQYPEFAVNVHNYLAYIYWHKGDSRNGWEQARMAKELLGSPERKKLREQIAINFNWIQKFKPSPATPRSAPTDRRED